MLAYSLSGNIRAYVNYVTNLTGYVTFAPGESTTFAAGFS
jgi:hypothetical protein